jgi:hypothetical protein
MGMRLGIFVDGVLNIAHTNLVNFQAEVPDTESVEKAIVGQKTVSDALRRGYNQRYRLPLKLLASYFILTIL